MKSKKLLYLALVSCSLFIASCSMNKNSISSSNSGVNKMLYAQQLEGQKVAILPFSDNTKSSPKNSLQGQQDNLPGTPSAHVQIPVFQQQKNSNPAIASIRKQFNKPILVAAASHVVNKIEKLRNAGSRTAAHKDLPFADSNLLVMWIVFLLISILLYVIAALFAAASLPGILFTILGFIAGLIFLYFLILWIIQLYKASNK